MKRVGHSIFRAQIFVPPDASGLTANSITVRLGAGKTETEVVVPVRRVVPVPIGRAQVLRVVVPAPAAYHAVSPRGGAHAV